MSSTRTARARAQASNLTNLAHANTRAHAHTNRPYLGRVWERSRELKAGLWSVGEMPRGKKRGGAERRERCCFPDGKLRLPALSLSVCLSHALSPFRLCLLCLHSFFSAPSFSPMPPLVPLLHLLTFYICLRIHDHRGWDADLRTDADNNDHQGPLCSKVFSQVQMCVVML